MTAERRSGGSIRAVVGVLGAAAIVLIAVLVGTQLPGLLGPSPEAEATPSPTPTITPSISPVPSARESPSLTPAPTEPEVGVGAPLLSYSAACDAVPPVILPITTVLDDGRVVWRGLDGAYLERRLTADGLQRLRDEVTGTGLFETSARHDAVRRPDAPDGPNHGACLYSFAWTEGAEPAVEVEAIQWFGAEEEATYFEPSPERETLDGLAQALAEPEAWLEPAAWEDQDAVTFVPEDYLVLASVTVPQLATEGAPDFDAISWPFEADPDAFGEAVGSSEPQARCDTADAGAIRPMAEALAAAGLEQFADPVFGAGATLPWASRGAAVNLSIWPLMPDGRPGCEGATG